jgi:hypothetical protein
MRNRNFLLRVINNLLVTNLDSMEQGLESYGGSNLKENVEIYLKSCGVTAEQIESIRNIFLGG